MAYELTEQKKVGLGIIGFGFFFTFLGVMLFFDRGLLALANIFCLVGVALLVGWHSTLNIFFSGANYKCSNNNCRVAYHPLCARAAGLCVEIAEVKNANVAFRSSSRIYLKHQVLAHLKYSFVLGTTSDGTEWAQWSETLIWDQLSLLVALSIDERFPNATFYFDKSLSLRVYPYDYLFPYQGLWCIGWQNSGVGSTERQNVTLLGDATLRVEPFPNRAQQVQ